MEVLGTGEEAHVVFPNNLKSACERNEGRLGKWQGIATDSQNGRKYFMEVSFPSGC